MGGALMGAMIERGVCRAEEVVCTDKCAAVLESRQREYGVQTRATVGETVAATRYVFLCTKPQDVGTVMAEVRAAWRAAENDQVLVSICAGVKLASLAALLPAGAKVVRVMPNMPCLVAMMAAGYAASETLTDADADAVHRMLSAAGVAYRLPEDMLDAVTGLSGSGPAYVAHLIEAFARAGERMGLPADVAYGLSLETFRGTAELMREKKLDPQELKTIITSPNGTTFAGRSVFEASDVADIVERTVDAGRARSVELGLPTKH